MGRLKICAFTRFTSYILKSKFLGWSVGILSERWNCAKLVAMVY